MTREDVIHGQSQRIKPAIERLRTKYEVRDDGCWQWTASRDVNGYGQIWSRAQGGPVKAYRLAYELLVGPVPAGLEIDHLCRNRRCVNPAHLEPVTHAENCRRGRNQFFGQTHCKSGHEFTEANTRWRGGTRLCVACRRRSAREAQRRLRARRAAQ